jgi:hypothetical protein
MKTPQKNNPKTKQNYRYTIARLRKYASNPTLHRILRGALGGIQYRNTASKFSVNNRSFLFQNCKYRIPQDFQYRNIAIFQGKYRNTVRKIS